MIEGKAKTRVLFVCLGNICRSPTAEAVFRRQVERAQLQDSFVIDSAGTAAYHIGEPPDRRSIKAGAARDYDLSPLRARQVSDDDFSEFDYILAMDNENLTNLRHRCPADMQDKLSLFLDYSTHFSESEVPDPYFSNAQGFDRVIDLVEDASQGLLQALSR